MRDIKEKYKPRKSAMVHARPTVCVQLTVKINSTGCLCTVGSNLNRARHFVDFVIPCIGIVIRDKPDISDCYNSHGIQFLEILNFTRVTLIMLCSVHCENL